MPEKEHTMTWKPDEIKELLERKEDITIEKLTLSHYGVTAIIKQNI